MVTRIEVSTALDAGGAARRDAPRQTTRTTEARHFGKYLTVLTSLVGGVAVFELLGYGLYHERWIQLGAITLICYFIALVAVARPLLKRGHTTQAVMITCFGMLMMTLSYVIVVPALYPVLVGLPVVVVATALPFAGIRLLNVLAVTAWLTTLAIGAFGLWYRAPEPASPFLSILNLVGIGCVFSLVLMLLVQYRIRSRMQLKEVQQANAALRYANQELEAFSYSVSHDLRAPLRAINGYSDALMEDYRERLDDEAVVYLDNLKRGATRMGSLIDDLLSLSQVNRTVLRRKQVDLSKLASRIVRDAAPPDRVRFTVEPNLTASADAALIEVLLNNLLGNALKFSAHVDSPRVHFGRSVEGGEVHFAVSDNGAGFDMRYIDKLFKPFQRLHTERDFPGTGIGLATCARVVHKHDGRIWATSTVGRGTTIHFTLDRGKTP